MAKELDWNEAIGQRIRIYRNLNNGRMSIQQKPERSWLVTGHVTDCIIRDVRFHISESGRQRVINDRRKNVHAWGEGILIAQAEPDIFAPVELAYDPYTNRSFIQRGTSHAIAACRYLVVRGNRVFVSPDAIAPSLEKPRFRLPELPLFDRLQSVAA